MSILLGLLTQFWPVLVLAGVALVSFIKGQSSGSKRELAKHAAAEAKARDVADDIQNDIGAMSPEQRREELRKWAR